MQNQHFYPGLSAIVSTLAPLALRFFGKNTSAVFKAPGFRRQAPDATRAHPCSLIPGLTACSCLPLKVLVPCTLQFNPHAHPNLLPNSLPTSFLPACRSKLRFEVAAKHEIETGRVIRLTGATNDFWKKLIGSAPAAARLTKTKPCGTFKRMRCAQTPEVLERSASVACFRLALGACSCYSAPYPSFGAK